MTSVHDMGDPLSKSRASGLRRITVVSKNMGICQRARAVTSVFVLFWSVRTTLTVNLIQIFSGQVEYSEVI